MLSTLLVLSFKNINDIYIVRVLYLFSVKSIQNKMRLLIGIVVSP